ncbi:MAG: FkbM family methyltransferase [Gemmatimonadota bacterium]
MPGTITAGQSIDESGPAGATNVVLAFETSTGRSQVKLRLDADSPGQRRLVTSFEAGEFYEPEVAYFLTAMLEPGDHFVDIGAHLGYFSLIASRAVGSTGMVVAFEPEPKKFARILGHVADNAMANVKVFNHALGARTGEGTFYLNAAGEIGLPAKDASQFGRRAMAVSVNTLDGSLEGIDSEAPLRIVRMNAAGCEHDVIRGAMWTLAARQVPYIICRSDRSAQEGSASSESAIRALMTLMGYHGYLMKPDASGLAELPAESESHEPQVTNVLFSREEFL